jgi:hypothetical protein
MTLPRFLKRKTGLSLAVVFFWGIYFFLSPFLHFHPDDVHAHAGEGRLHHHEGHVHSEELEALAHAWDLHPADHERDDHHPHSSPEHDSDKIEISIKSTSLKQADPDKIAKHRAAAFHDFSFGPVAVGLQPPPRFPVLKATGPWPFQERSPPSRIS